MKNLISKPTDTGRNILFTGALLLLALAQSPHARANVVTAVDITFRPGANLFGNPLNIGTNDLNHLFANPPEGTTLALWNTPAQQFVQTSVFTSGSWTLNLILPPGTGTLLTTPSLFTVQIAGEVQNASGGPLSSNASDGFDLLPPSPFAGPDGVYLFSSKLAAVLPFNSGGNNSPPNTDFDAFSLIIGRPPNSGESVTRLDTASQTCFTTTFDGVGWNNGIPGLAVGEAAFFNVGPVVVPEPSTLALSICSAFVAGVTVLQRRRGARAACRTES